VNVLTDVVRSGCSVFWIALDWAPNSCTSFQTGNIKISAADLYSYQYNGARNPISEDGTPVCNDVRFSQIRTLSMVQQRLYSNEEYQPPSRSMSTAIARPISAGIGHRYCYTSSYTIKVSWYTLREQAEAEEIDYLAISLLG